MEWEVLAFTLPLMAPYITLVKYMGGERKCTYVHVCVCVYIKKFKIFCIFFTSVSKCLVIITEFL